MGNKVHPKIFRTGVIFGWGSKWYAAGREYSRLLREDTKIREFLAEQLKECSVDRVDIERTARAMTITVHSAKPGAIIGRGGDGIETLKTKIRQLLVGLRRGQAKAVQAKDAPNVNLNVIEVSKPNLSSQIVLQSMIAEIEKRMPFRRVLKTHMDRIQKAGAKGVKLQVKGRLNGAEIAREEKIAWGSVPLHNLRADIDYAAGFARTMFGAIGIKVWIYRGDIFQEDIAARAEQAQAQPQPANRFRGRPGSRGPRREGGRG